MSEEAKADIAKQIAAHRATEDGDIARLRALSFRERDALIEAACEAAAEIERSRRAMGLPPTKPDPWPESTREFFRKHAARVRK